VITRLEAYRYRCFAKLSVDVGEFNILAGANGSGKTTLLDIPILLGDLITQRVCNKAFLESQPSRRTFRAHTLTELIHQERGEDFVIAVEARLPEEVAKLIAEPPSQGVQKKPKPLLDHLRYEILFQVFNKTDLQVSSEYLYLFASATARPEAGIALQGVPSKFVGKIPSRPVLQQRTWRSVLHRDSGEPVQFQSETNGRAKPTIVRVPPDQIGLASLPYDKTDFPAAVWFQDFLRSGVLFYEPDWRTLRKASPPGQPGRLAPAGENLPWLALDLHAANPERFRDWVDHVRTALPQVVDVRAIEREEDHHAYFEVHYEGGYRVTSSGLSDGTLRILALTLVPYMLRKPSILVTEEPENGVHPRGVQAILQSLSSMYDGQVWISTHSPVVLANTSLSQILCSRMNQEGAVEVIPGPQHPRLQDWKGTIELGALFAAGVLG
jgi:ABC-type Mn2+/Zn2+ transport system ATPase subunit